MAPNELKYWEENLETPKGAPLAPTDLDESRPKDPLKDLFAERKKHRERLLSFIQILTVASFLLLTGIIIVQAVVRARGNLEFTILQGHELEILVTGVFGQIIGLVYVIVKSLWDDKNYLDILRK